MQRLIILIVLALGSLGAAGAGETGRYQVAVGAQSTVLVDTRSGRSWILTPARYRSGSPQQNRYEWSPIGLQRDAPPAAVKPRE